MGSVEVMWDGDSVPPPRGVWTDKQSENTTFPILWIRAVKMGAIHLLVGLISSIAQFWIVHITVVQDLVNRGFLGFFFWDAELFCIFLCLDLLN